MPDTRTRQNTVKLKSDKDIRLATKLHAFERQEALLDAMTLLGRASIFVVPTLALLAVIALGIRYILTGNWTTLENYTKQFVLLVAGYIIAYLQKNGLTEKK